MRYIIYISIFLASVFCFVQAQAQGVSMFGASRAQDTSKTKGQIVAPAYSNNDSNKVLTADASGHFYYVTKSNGSAIDTTKYIMYSDTSRSGIVTTYYYVDSLFDNIPVSDLSGIRDTIGALYDTAADIRYTFRPAGVIGEIYNADTWSNLDTFRTSPGFTQYSIVGGNIKFPATGSANPNAFSLDYLSGLDRWDITAKVIIDTNTNQQIGFGRYGAGCFASNLYVNYNRATGKLYARINTSDILDSSAYGVPAIVGDTLVMRVWYAYDNMVIRGYIYNLRSDSAVSVEYSAGEAEVKGASNTATMISAGYYSVFADGGGFTLDSLYISSNTIKNPDLILIGNSKMAGATPSNVNNSYAKKITRAYPNGVVNLAGSGNCIQTYLDMREELERLNGKQALVSLGYNDYFSGLSQDTINARYTRLADMLEEIGTRRIALLPQYDNIDQSGLRTHEISITDPEDIIDVYAATAALGSAGLADGIHPNDTGHAVIFQGIMNSGKIWGSVSNDWTAIDNIVNNRNYQYDINRPMFVTGRTGETGTQTIATFYNPNSGTLNNTSVGFAVNGSKTPRVILTGGLETSVFYYYLGIGAGTTGQSIAAFRSDIKGLAINIPAGQSPSFVTGLKILSDGALAVYAPTAGTLDTVVVAGNFDNLSTRHNRIKSFTSGTAANNHWGFFISDGTNFGEREVLRIGYNGISTVAPSANGAGVYKLGKVLTGSDTNKYVEIEIDGVIYYIRALTSLP